MLPSKDSKWSEAARNLIVEEELKQCTFQPKITKHKSPFRGKTSQMISSIEEIMPAKNRDNSKIRSKDFMP